MTPREFHNALRILRSIQTDELLSFGVIDENWGTLDASDRDQMGAFIADPYTEALRMPDANFDRLYALIESRRA